MKFKSLQLSQTNFLILLSLIVGTATGLGAYGFRVLIEYFNHLFFGMTDQILTTSVAGDLFGGIKWWLPLIPMAGGLLVGPIVYKYASEAKGHGVPEVMNAVARLGGIIRPRVAAAKTIASAICIGSGGSAGREGPIVQIGSAIGSTIGQWFRLSGNRVKVLVGSGAAAGIAAVFNAPIAGVIFALEIILGDFAVKTFSPVLLSAVVSSLITWSLVGNYPAFTVPGYSLVSAWEILLYVIMAVGLGGVAVGFTRMLDATETFFDRLKMPNMAKPALGGLLLGGIAVIYPQVLADGYQTITLTLHGQLDVWLLAVLIVMKILATCFTLGSGNSGGIFAPSLFIGAVSGGAFGVLVNYLFPGSTATPGAYALVGMAGMVAGATHAPITAMLIIFEMTRDYRIILPLMVTVVISTLVAGRLFPHSIYTVKLFKRGIDLRGGKDVNVLRSHRVRDVMDSRFEIIPTATPLVEIFRRLEESRESYFVVEDRAGLLRGVISFQDLRAHLSQHELDNLVVAADLVAPGTVTVFDDDDLGVAYEIFGQRDYTLIPVVTRSTPGKVIGVVRREELVDYYNKRLIDTLRS
ncbi:MAG: chloride channel protein [candidate division Zixibacteria bacterium]|jgi:CIC family chloride channel protein|nr:chloride channel protein [candidate division Zixibacteria bacterium]